MGGYVLLQFQGTFSEISFRIPIVEYTYTFGYSGFNFGIPDVQACPTVTCNNNNTCETGESCNCADCTNGGTDDKDKCGLTTSGAQMECTKDKDNSTTTLNFDPSTAQANFVAVDAELKPYLLQGGNANISANEFGTAATNLQMTQDSQLTFFPSFTKEEAWARVKELLSIPDSKPVLWSKTSDQYGNT